MLKVKHNKVINHRQQAGWTSAASLVLRFYATLPQNNQHSSGRL
ncbi:hypothetical protein TERTU_1809 [Teredinibacter turnerae T7901]|uniref:Uncharacterized protein n=1 Tax=Teredinibacter turnerae (strain ATCC 39867 / T7901) TaxID=377629 RepID=C5BHS9_TERTT|nr:hypothetical protein TERTU_1809 [Teredinibacter turnerae T7901]